MADKKTIVLVGSSEKSWEDAARNVVRKASDSVRTVDAIDIVHLSADSDKAGEIVRFRATVQISFEIDQGPREE